MSYSASFGYLREYRNMPWIGRGVKVLIDGKSGYVAGSFAGNIAVKFSTRKYTVNCHPFWHAIYLDAQGNVLRNYYENQSWVSDGRDHELL